MRAKTTFSTVSTLVNKHIESGLFFGAEVLLAQGHKVLFRETFGTTDGTHPLPQNAVFDVASLTKPVVTASLLLALGLPLSARAVQYLPAFKGGGKETITLHQLATHCAGLPPTVRFSETCGSSDAAYEALLNVPLAHPPGHKVVYSCLGYLLLGKILEAASGQSLQSLFQTRLAEPLEMVDSGFLPLSSTITKKRLVPAGNQGHAAFQPGIVHDGNARLFGGVAGNAGLFTTVEDLHRFAQNLISPSPLFSPALMFANQSTSGDIPRSIGWEVQSNQWPASCGPAFFEGAIGHTGFTGTSIWLDKASGTLMIVLSNRSAISHSGTLDEMRQFRRDIHQCVFESVKAAD